MLFRPMQQRLEGQERRYRGDFTHWKSPSDWSWSIWKNYRLRIDSRRLQIETSWVSSTMSSFRMLYPVDTLHLSISKGDCERCDSTAIWVLSSFRVIDWATIERSALFFLVPGAMFCSRSCHGWKAWFSMWPWQPDEFGRIWLYGVNLHGVRYLTPKSQVCGTSTLKGQ